MKNTKPNPRCGRHTDCFAYKRGNCLLLTENNFGEKDCPFYKTQAEHLKGRIAAAEKLKASGRTDLIELYYKSVKLFEKMLESDKAELSALPRE